ncbi:MAG: hypothetical protein IPJ46_21195 [Anaerolineales bacterium]|nr:hypothetical protein [Anaerolineales bacterium]
MGNGKRTDRCRPNHEDRGCVFLQIPPPDFCATELEAEMIAIAEKHLTSATLDRDRKPRFWVSSGSQDKARL